MRIGRSAAGVGLAAAVALAAGCGGSSSRETSGGGGEPRSTSRGTEGGASSDGTGRAAPSRPEENLNVIDRAGRTAEVTGKVLLDGAPLGAGTVTFVAIDGRAAPVAAPVKDGAFSLKAPVGTSRVEIRAPRVVGKTKTYDKPEAKESSVTEELLPARYNAQSELRFEVKLGANEATFDLKSK
jgi:hypothetical protein